MNGWMGGFGGPTAGQRLLMLFNGNNYQVPGTSINTRYLVTWYTIIWIPYTLVSPVLDSKSSIFAAAAAAVLRCRLAVPFC